MPQNLLALLVISLLHSWHLGLPLARLARRVFSTPRHVLLQMRCVEYLGLNGLLHTTQLRSLGSTP